MENAISETEQQNSDLSRDLFCDELMIAVNDYSERLYGIMKAKMEIQKSIRRYLITKRVADMLSGASGLLVLSPFLLTVAAAIKLTSRGPALYSQKRTGKDGKIFKIYKFRTMVKDAEKKTGPVWAKKNDPRLTILGKFLRDSKIDELPQLINVVKGDMSLVGPRPERPYFTDMFLEIVPGYARRLEVLPGITGLAQLENGYDETPADVIRKLCFDVTYIKNMSLFTDIRLLLRTFWSVLVGKL